jgi:hypothetical protein
MSVALLQRLGRPVKIPLDGETSGTTDCFQLGHGKVAEIAFMADNHAEADLGQSRLVRVSVSLGATRAFVEFA